MHEIWDSERFNSFRFRSMQVAKYRRSPGVKPNKMALRLHSAITESEEVFVNITVPIINKPQNNQLLMNILAEN
jgi:hypothetical protein